MCSESNRPRSLCRAHVLTRGWGEADRPQGSAPSSSQLGGRQGPPLTAVFSLGPRCPWLLSLSTSVLCSVPEVTQTSLTMKGQLVSPSGSCSSLQRHQPRLEATERSGHHAASPCGRAAGTPNLG